MCYKPNAPLVRFLRASQSQHAPFDTATTRHLLAATDPTFPLTRFYAAHRLRKRMKTSLLCLQSMLLLLLFHRMLPQFGISTLSWMVSSKYKALVMLYCSYSSSMSLRCLRLGAIDNVKYACLLPKHCRLIAWKKPEGLGIITSRLISFLKLSFAATCADALEGPSTAPRMLLRKQDGKEGMPYWIHLRHTDTHLASSQLNSSLEHVQMVYTLCTTTVNMAFSL